MKLEAKQRLLCGTVMPFSVEVTKMCKQLGFKDKPSLNTSSEYEITLDFGKQKSTELISGLTGIFGKPSKRKGRDWVFYDFPEREGVTYLLSVQTEKGNDSESSSAIIQSNTLGY